VVLDANGITLRLTPVPDLQPQPFTIAGWEVADIEATVDALASVGITFLRFDGLEQNAKGSGRHPAEISSPGSPTPTAIPCH
jgi:hypothetical protein